MPPTSLIHLIGGHWIAGQGEPITSTSPADPARTVAAGRSATTAQLAIAVASAASAARSWAATPPHERGTILLRAASIVEASADDWGAQLADEEGKTRTEGVGEVLRSAQILKYFGNDASHETGANYHSPRRGERIIVTHRAIGVVGVITPFNFPIAIPAWKISPALAYGNTVVWKPAETVPLLALRLAQALDGAGLPPGVLNLIFGGGPLGEALVDHPDVDAVTFTGSTEVGRRIAAAGALRGIPVQAEMGGKNAAIVLADADLRLAAEQVIAGAFKSSGQKCTATSRLVVADVIADEFLARLVNMADELTVGDPLAAGVMVGPLISHAARSSVEGGISHAIAQGAIRLTSRTTIEDLSLRAGFYVHPTILDCSGIDVDLWNRELFGPVLAVRRASSAVEAFAVANEGDYGLSAAVFTNKLSSALFAIDELNVGMLHINSETAGADPHVPFGATKRSGLGPKEQGQAARSFYTQSTTVYLRDGA